MIAGRRLRINWKVGVFTLVMLPVLISLGFWQLDREAEKRTLQARYEERSGGVPLSLSEVRDMEDPAFVALRVTGEYEPERSFLLDNRIHEGRPGYEVITPLRTEEDGVLLVNRGWVPMARSREQLPEMTAPSGTRTIRANVYAPTDDPVMLGDESVFDGWPRRMQQVDTERMYEELGENPDAGFPYTLRLQSGESGVLARPWQPVSTSPEKHRGYAVQWFSMAAALVLLFIYSCFPRDRGEQ